MSAKIFVKHVAWLARSVFRIARLASVQCLQIVRGTFACLPDSPRNNSPDQICVVTSLKHFLHVTSSGKLSKTLAEEPRCVAFSDFHESSSEPRSSRRMLNQPPPALLAMIPPPPGPVDLTPPPRPAPPPLPLPANKLREADAIQRRCGIAQCYDDLAVEPDDPAIQGLVSECMTADELTCFVMTVGGPGIAPALC